MQETIVYEQPLNEVIRVCLRLEQIFEQIDHQLHDSSMLATRNVITSIIHVLQILDRPDLKAKLAKELSSHLTNLMRYDNSPQLDSQKYEQLVNQLKGLSRDLIDSSGKIGHRLRDVELLNTLRLQLASPGGGCSFDSPVYHYWLQQPPTTRQAVIQDWINDFSQIKTAYALILNLVRKNAKVEQKTAVHGFHQELLDPQANLRMIRIGIPREFAAFPETSIGRHFFSVRFFAHDIISRPTQYTQNLPFWVAYCNL